MLKLIIFDLDGPILNSFKRSEEGVSIGVKKLIQKIGISPEKAFLNPGSYLKYWGYPGSKTAALMFPLLAGDELKIIIDCWAKNERNGKIPLVRGALKILRYLKQKGILCILLTSRSHNLRFHLNDYHLDNFFEIVQSWKNPKWKKEKIHRNHIFCPYHKPNPKVLNPILKWAAEKGVSKKEMIMIDDTLVGLETAIKCGLKFLGVCTGPLDSKEKWQRYGNLGEKYVINSIADLPRWLEKHAHVAQLVRAQLL